MAVISYSRVSTTDQSHEKDREPLEDYIKKRGLTYSKCFEDSCTGTNFDRPAFKQMLDYVRPGDEIVVLDMTRYGRNAEQIVETLDLLRKRGVIVRILSIPATLQDFSSSGDQIMDLFQNLIFDIIIQVYAIMAEQEYLIRKSRLERGMKEKVRRCLEEGEEWNIGRKPLCDEGKFRTVYAKYESGEWTKIKCMKELGIKNVKTWELYQRKLKRGLPFRNCKILKGGD